MINLIVLLVIALIIGGAITYIVKEKKKGAVCIGCPDAGKCSKHCSGQSTTQDHE